jgi:hypothetical protein
MEFVGRKIAQIIMLNRLFGANGCLKRQCSMCARERGIIKILDILLSNYVYLCEREIRNIFAATMPF